MKSFFICVLVAALGAGPQPIPVKRLSTPLLSAAIQEAIENKTMLAKAASMGDKIRSEQGVSETVRLIEESAATFRRP
jgi:sterol 3beta-glucosyltransferase